MEVTLKKITDLIREVKTELKKLEPATERFKETHEKLERLEKERIILFSAKKIVEKYK